MEKKLSPEETGYLKERGFEVICDQPPSDTQFPYITLREPQQWIEQSEMTYHRTPSSSTGTIGIAHPSTMPNDQLVALIESSVAKNISLDGKLFQTKPGQPIKVFIIDPAWKEVADALAVKYK